MKIKSLSMFFLLAIPVLSYGMADDQTIQFKVPSKRYGSRTVALRKDLFVNIMHMLHKIDYCEHEGDHGIFYSLRQEADPLFNESKLAKKILWRLCCNKKKKFRKTDNPLLQGLLALYNESKEGRRAVANTMKYSLEKHDEYGILLYLDTDRVSYPPTMFYDAKNDVCYTVNRTGQ